MEAPNTFMIEGLKGQEPDLDDFHSCWWWLHDHPYFFVSTDPDDVMCNEPGFTQTLEVFVTRVNPVTGRVDDNRKLNTQTEVWLECGPWLYDEHTRQRAPGINHDLDVGGGTYEEAIKNLAAEVMARFGDYPTYDLCGHCLNRVPAGENAGDDFFCSVECMEHGHMDSSFEPVEGSELLRWVGRHERCDCSKHTAARERAQTS